MIVATPNQKWMYVAHWMPCQVVRNPVISQHLYNTSF